MNGAGRALELLAARISGQDLFAPAVARVMDEVLEGPDVRGALRELLDAQAHVGEVLLGVVTMARDAAEGAEPRPPGPEGLLATLQRAAPDLLGP